MLLFLFTGSDELFKGDLMFHQTGLTHSLNGGSDQPSKAGTCGLADCLFTINKHGSGLCECGERESNTLVIFNCSKDRVERRYF